jgi:hypothetical protein
VADSLAADSLRRSTIVSAVTSTAASSKTAGTQHGSRTDMWISSRTDEFGDEWPIA